MPMTVTVGDQHGRKMLQANRMTRVTLAGDSNYPTGGYPLADLLAAKSEFADQAVVHVIATEDGNYRYAWVHSTGKLKFLNVDTGAEIADTTDVSAANAIEALVLSE